MVRARKNPAPDGRANNGGQRQGTPGQSYANRSDLQTQKITVPPSNQYGQGEQLRRAQQAVPMAGAPATPTGGGPPQPGPMGQGAPLPPPDLYRPSERPGEPVTHGLPVGAGAGPEALQVTGAGNAAMTDPVAIQLRALYQRYVQSAQTSPSVAADLAAALDDVR